MARSYEITERPANLGGGWVLTMFENGEEMGRGYYPLLICRSRLPMMTNSSSPLTPCMLRLKPRARAGKRGTSNGHVTDDRAAP